MHITPGTCLHVPSLSSGSALLHCFENASNSFTFSQAGRLGGLQSWVGIKITLKVFRCCSLVTGILAHLGSPLRHISLNVVFRQFFFFLRDQGGDSYLNHAEFSIVFFQMLQSRLEGKDPW